MKTLSSASENAYLLCESPGRRVPLIALVDYSAIDSGLTTEAPYLASVTGVDRIENWTGLSKEQYKLRRAQWMESILRAIDKEFPGFATAVVHKEMATALTMQKYLNTPNGALYGFAPRPPEHLPIKGPEHTPKTTVKGLWLASAFAGSGGYTGAMMSGAIAAKMALARIFHKTGPRNPG